MTTAEVMTVALVAPALFCGNQERSRLFLKEHGYIRPMLSKGNFNRRLHEVPERFGKPSLTCWLRCICRGMKAKSMPNESQEYAE